MTTAEQIGPGGVNESNRPIFLSTEHTRYAPSTTRELTDQEQLAWKAFQLWRTSKSMDRRDSVYNTIINSDYTNFNLAFHIMGSPFPVIDNTPHLMEVFRCIRWYEHLTSFSAAYMYSMWIHSKATTRAAKMLPASLTLITCGTFCMMEVAFGYRSLFRLAGFLPNDYECRKYGVLEDSARLQRKKALWDRYAAYKKEWCRRFDYHVYGIRPGENWSLFSACWFPSWEPIYGRETCYPRRKNPYFITAKPLEDIFTENRSFTDITKTESSPLIKVRPELKYLFAGPKEAAKSTKPVIPS